MKDGRKKTVHGRFMDLEPEFWTVPDLKKQDITAENHCGVKNRSFILPQDRGVRNLQSGSHVGKTGITKLEKRSS